MADEMSHDDLGGLDPAETRRHAEEWVKWAKHDLEHFIEPFMQGTGLSRVEALLYLMGERLGQLAEEGFTMHVYTKHVEEQPPDEADDWKKE